MAWRRTFQGELLDGADLRLVRSAADGDAAGVQSALSEGASANVTFADDEGTYNMTPLMLAAQGGHVDAMRVLLKAKARVKAKDKFISPDDGGGETALEYAVRAKQSEAARLLIEAGANIDAIGGGYTALMMATMKGDASLVRLLLDLGADPNVSSKVCSALSLAVDRHQPKIAKILLEGGANPNWAGFHFKETPLIDACKRGLLESAKVLLEHGADPNQADSLDRFPLYEAATGGVVRQLKTKKDWEEFGSAPNLVGSCLMTDENALEIVQLLLAHGADVDHVGDGWGTALDGARKAGRTEICRVLEAAKIQPAK